MLGTPRAEDRRQVAPVITSKAAAHLKRAQPCRQGTCWPSKAEDRAAFVLSFQTHCKEKTKGHATVPGLSNMPFATTAGDRGRQPPWREGRGHAAPGSSLAIIHRQRSNVGPACQHNLLYTWCKLTELSPSNFIPPFTADLDQLYSQSHLQFNQFKERKAVFFSG